MKGPKEWKKGIIVPIKKGDGKIIGNYREVTLASTGSKI